MDYRLGDLSFSLRSRPPSLCAQLERDLAPFATDEPAARRFTVRRSSDIDGFEVVLDRHVVHRTLSQDGIRDYILWRISAEALELVRDRIAIHAGAVSSRRRGVILPAPPDSGKSTLTAALVQRGFRYLSDEVALIDPSSYRLIPFPRHLWLEPDGRSALSSIPSSDATWLAPGRDASKPLHAFPSAGAGGDVPVRLVVFPRFEPGARTDVRPLSRAEAVVALARNSFNFQAFGGAGLQVLADMMAGATAYSLTMSDLPEATAAIEELLRGPERST